jgi:chromosome segregation ATPase
LRERDERLAKEVESLKGRLGDVTAELEHTASRFHEEARHKILLQADVAKKREELAALNQNLRGLEDEMGEMKETSKDADNRESSLTAERDLFKAQLASTCEELETTQATLQRERAGYGKMTAEWGQMTAGLYNLNPGAPIA